MTQPSAAPQNIEAEESVLGAILVTRSAQVAAIEDVGLTATDFYLDRHRAIFEAAHDLYAASKPVDALCVADALTPKQREPFEKAGVDPRAYLSALEANVGAVGHAGHHAEIVQQNSLLRRLLGAGQEIQGWVNERAGNPQELLERADGLIGEVAATAPSERLGSSWRPCDLGDALAGKIDPAPTILTRSDGVVGLIPDERLTALNGEPESGKSLLAKEASRELLDQGCTVAYFDFESTPVETTQRLQTLGVSPEAILDRFIYVHPEEPLSASANPDLNAIFERKPALVVIDGVTEALTLHGLDLGSNPDIARFLEILPRPAARSGAAVLLIDHVVKDKESRGRYSIGAQHKLAGVDVSYTLEVIEPFGRGKSGLVRIKVNKDRSGHIRQHAEGDQIGLMRLSSDAETGEIAVSVDPPDSVDDQGDFRPTVLMERISRALETCPTGNGLTRREIRDLPGKSAFLDDAVRHLEDEGYIAIDRSGRSHVHTTVRPFRNDPEEVPA